MYLTYDIDTKEITRVDIFNFSTKNNVCLSFGENTKTVECDIPDDILSNLNLYLYDNGEFVYSEELEQKQKEQQLAQELKKLLKAFDSYKSNVIYGVLTETEEQKQLMLSWYKSALTLDEEAISNPPTEISQYL